MSVLSLQHPLVLVFGILGNIFSILVYLAPLRIFYGIYKKKSTEAFQSVPYVFALLSAMTWIYYAVLKSDSYLLISVNLFGCIMEAIYIAVFISYAPRKSKVRTAKILVLMNAGAFSLVVVLTMFLAKGAKRVSVMGWVCVAAAASVFAAPLAILRQVIRTKSVEFMPFLLSLFLTLSAIMWFSYGMVLKDYFVAIPNVIGFIFGVIQMVLYAIYKNKTHPADQKLPEHNVDVVKLSTVGSSEVHPVNINKLADQNKMDEAQIVNEQCEV